LKEAVQDLKAVGVFDRLEKSIPPEAENIFLTWRKKEIENYLCYPETLVAYARSEAVEASCGPLFESTEADRREMVMRESIQEIEGALRAINRPSPWADDAKVSDDFLEPLFNMYYQKLGLPNAMLKKNYHVLAGFVPEEKIDPEIKEKLDFIVKVAESARRTVEKE